MTTRLIPVVDLFAGPGGLGEGFAALRDERGQAVFSIALSIEMHQAAHRTLELRSFFRQFALVPDDYYAHLRGEIDREELFSRYKREAARARSIAWQARLGGVPASEVDARITRSLDGATNWVLCGGPPCQAYSVIGRARNGGIDADDHRLYLYREYLRILVKHRPSAFVLENVKGLLSSQVGDNRIFRQMLADLRQPAEAIGSRSAEAEYQLYSLVVPPKPCQAGEAYPQVEFRDFVIRCEQHGIPQSRHRVIILGLRRDLAPAVVPILAKSLDEVPAVDVLSGLPRLRSGLSRAKDGRAEWKNALAAILDGDRLLGIPNGNGKSIRDAIRVAIDRITSPRADRGAEFIDRQPDCSYRRDWFCDDRIGGVCNHISRPHIQDDLHRYLFAACYASLNDRSPELRDFPPRLLPNHKNVLDPKKQLYFDDRFRVQRRYHAATTVTSHIAKDGHYYIHYDERQCRSLTVREVARLQTFPDNYLFCGSRTEQYVQVGNAVPPLLAYQIAQVVANAVRPHRTTNPGSRETTRGAEALC